MNYTFTDVQTIAGCDALIDSVNKDKSDLEYRKLSLTRQRTSFDSNSVETTTELAQVVGELTIVTGLMIGLEEGDIKTDLQSKKLKLESKKFDLEHKVADYDGKAKIEKEFDIDRVDRQITAADELIAGLLTRKTELTV